MTDPAHTKYGHVRRRRTKSRRQPTWLQKGISSILLTFIRVRTFLTVTLLRIRILLTATVLRIGLIFTVTILCIKILFTVTVLHIGTLFTATLLRARIHFQVTVLCVKMVHAILRSRVPMSFKFACTRILLTVVCAPACRQVSAQ